MSQFPILINHPVHAPVMPRSCQSQEEYDALALNGWYTEGTIPSPIPPGDVPLVPPVVVDPVVEPIQEDDPTVDSMEMQADDHLVNTLNVSNAKVLIEATTSLDELALIERAERDHKNRAGVLDVIVDRRNQIAASETD